MDLSDNAILFLSIFVLTAIIAALFYILRGVRRNRNGTDDLSYNWQPEQDYDVEWSDEGPMSPPFPKLKKRDEAGSKRPLDR